MTRDDTYEGISCLAAPTLGSGARKGVGVQIPPLAPTLTCVSFAPNDSMLRRSDARRSLDAPCYDAASSASTNWLWYSS